MTLVEGGGGTIGAREIAVLRGERGLQVRRIVDRVRPGIGRQELVMVAEALAEIDGQPIVVRCAIGIVGVHVAKGDAVRIIGCGRHRVAFRVESGERREKSLCLRYAIDLRRIATSVEGNGYGWIQSAGAKEVH